MCVVDVELRWGEGRLARRSRMLTMSGRPAQSKAGGTFFTLATAEETVRMYLTLLNRLELLLEQMLETALFQIYRK